jgi:hypothetical protein
MCDPEGVNLVQEQSTRHWIHLEEHEDLEGGMGVGGQEENVNLRNVVWKYEERTHEPNHFRNEEKNKLPLVRLGAGTLELI